MGISRSRSRGYNDRSKKTKNVSHSLGSLRPLGPGNFKARLRIVVIFLIFIVLVAGYFLAWSNYFLVTKVLVGGSSQIDSEAVSSWFEVLGKKRKLGIIPENHIALLNRDGVEEILKSKSLYIAGLNDFARIWPNGLRVEIEDRSPVAIWNSGERYFYIDRTSTLYDLVSADYAQATDTYLVIKDYDARALATGTDLGYQDTVNFVLEIGAFWERYIGSRPVELGITSELGREVYFTSDEGWQVYFDAGENAEHQIKSLDVILTKVVTNANRPRLAYVDLRVPGRAYYCYVDEPCHQQNDEIPTEEATDLTQQQ